MVQMILLLSMTCSAASASYTSLRGSRRSLFTAGSWSNVFAESFDSGIGSHFSLGNTDDSSVHTLNDVNVIKLKDNMGADSSLTSRLIDMSLYSQIELSFDYMAEGFEVGDDLVVEFQNEDTGPWYTALELVLDNTGFVNSVWYTQTIRWMLYAGPSTPVNNIKIRFRASGDDDTDIVYVDNVSISGKLIDDQPTSAPTVAPVTPAPTAAPTKSPTAAPQTPAPTAAPTKFPTAAPTKSPTAAPQTPAPTAAPTKFPTAAPTKSPTAAPQTPAPTAAPTGTCTVPDSCTSAADCCGGVSYTCEKTGKSKKAPSVCVLQSTPSPTASPGTTPSPTAAPTAAPGTTPSPTAAPGTTPAPTAAPIQTCKNDRDCTNGTTCRNTGGGIKQCL